MDKNAEVLGRVMSGLRKVWEHTGGSAAKGVARLGEYAEHPIKGTAEGWKGMEPLANKSKSEIRKKMFDLKRRGKSLHLFDKSRPLSKTKGVKGFTEELSRRGWTGQGKITKYMPVGDKGLFTLFNAPLVHKAAKGDLEGGDVGSTMGWLAATRKPTGLVGWLTASELGRLGGNAAERAGRFVLNKPKKLAKFDASDPRRIATIADDVIPAIGRRMS